METLRSFLVAVLSALLAASTVAAFQSGGGVMERVMLGGNCRGTVAECLSAADEFGFSSEVARRFLATSDYISYGALQADRTPCSITGASYYNCRPGAGANPYTRSLEPLSLIYPPSPTTSSPSPKTLALEARKPASMAAPSSQKQRQHQEEFPHVTVIPLSALSSSSAAEGGASASACFYQDQAGRPLLRLRQLSSPDAEPLLDLKATQIFRLGPLELLCMNEELETGDSEEKSSRAYRILLRTKDETKAFHSAFIQWKIGSTRTRAGGPLENGSLVVSKSKFDDKIEATSAKMYFHYYGQLLHQQNMLQDYVRTGTYYAAVIENRIDFQGRVVVDVGAGSGILSLFAAQAGAKHVYAVEASEMAEYAQRLISGNPSLGERITVIKGKIEDVELPEKADILISEPMGTLLVNERMLETYVIARDRFLVPNGKMFPSIGRIHMAPFSDEYLYVEIANKALFWQQQNFYGVDLTPLHGSAFQGYFSQPVVEAFDPRCLVSLPMSHTLDFNSIKEEELYEIDVPLNFVASVGTRVHGLACWFDVLFNGSSVQRWLTTAPGSPTTHWYQLRCVLAQPLYVMAGQEITGRLHLVAHSAQSYTIHLTLSAKMWGVGAEQGGILQTSSGKFDLKEPYYRMSQPQPYMFAQDQQSHQQLIQAQDASPQTQDGSIPSMVINSEPKSEAFDQ